jgi:hypothetical protein
LLFEPRFVRREMAVVGKVPGHVVEHILGPRAGNTAFRRTMFETWQQVGFGPRGRDVPDRTFEKIIFLKTAAVLSKL